MCSAPEPRADTLACYEIGGLRIAVSGPPFHETEYLGKFRVPASEEADYRLRVEALPTLALPEGVAFRASVVRTVDPRGRDLRLCLREDRSALLYRALRVGEGEILARIPVSHVPLLGSKLILELLDLPSLVLERGGAFLHASFVLHRGRAILFSAPKQTGKSTQAALWARCRGAEIVNGDRALLRQVDGTWYAFGSPYCGTSGICENRSAPLGAVILLRQGPTNQLRRAEFRQIAGGMLAECTYDPTRWAETSAILTLAQSLAEAVPVLTFSCLPDPTAVETLDEGLREGGFYG